MKRALTIASFLVVWVSVVSTQAPQPTQGAPGGQQPGAPAQGAPAGQGGRAARTPITPRITRFEATPSSIKPGESVVLSWATEAGTPTIDNGVGAVPPRGTAKITPKATTTYTLTMGDVTRSVTVTVAGTAARFVRQKDARESRGQFVRDLLQVHQAAGTGRAFDLKRISIEMVIPLQGFHEQIINREPDRAAPVRIAAKQP